jgi:acid phosphatase
MYHRSLGYGNELAPFLGIPWVSASTRLLAGTANTTQANANSSADTQNLWISFTHREGTLAIFYPHGMLMGNNRTSLHRDRAWLIQHLECINAGR